MENATLPENPLAVDGEGVFFRFGGRKSAPVLKGLDISVEKGVIYGLLGPSGCGKTTLLRCIVGRHKPSSGTIKVFGKTPGQSGCTVPGPGVGFMPQELALYPEITTQETLTYFGKIYQMEPNVIKERISFLTSFLDIPDKNKLIRCLSGGQQRRVSFAVALIHKPPLLMLDEPTVGVDPLLRKSIWEHLQELATADSITIIITTHYVEEARQAQVVGLMRDGRLLAETNPEVLIEQHNALTLEEVFLKLCVKDSEATETTSLIELKAFDEDSVRVKKRINHTKYNAITSNQGQEHYETNLLNDSSKATITISRQNDLRKTDSRKIDCKSSLKKTWNRMNALNLKNFVRLKRNIPLLVFQIVVPVFQVIVFCLCIGGEPYDIPIAIVNLETDPSGKSNAFLRTLSTTTFIKNNFSTLSSALESVERGENWGVIYIPEIFTDSMINRFMEGMYVDNATIQNSTIKMYLDMTNQQIISTVHSKIMESFQNFSRQALKDFFWNPEIANPPIVIAEPVYGDIEPNFSEFMAPGMMVGITYIMAMGLSAMVVIIEKKEGLLDRSWFAGVRSWEVMFSMFLSLCITMLLQVALVLVLTFKVFNIPCKGPLFWVVVAVFLTGLEGMSYGLLISAIINDENIAMMVAMGSFYPSVLLSGIIWPVEAMPYYLRKISYCLPLTLIASSLRSLLSRGLSIMENGVYLGFLVCLAWIFPVLFIASLFFKYKK